MIVMINDHFNVRQVAGWDLYLVLWGRGKEMKKVSQLVPEEDQDRGIEVVVSARTGRTCGSRASGEDLGVLSCLEKGKEPTNA